MCRYPIPLQPASKSLSRSAASAAAFRSLAFLSASSCFSFWLALAAGDLAGVAGGEKRERNPLTIRLPTVSPKFCGSLAFLPLPPLAVRAGRGPLPGCAGPLEAPPPPLGVRWAAAASGLRAAGLRATPGLPRERRWAAGEGDGEVCSEEPPASSSSCCMDAHTVQEQPHPALSGRGSTTLNNPFSGPPTRTATFLVFGGALTKASVT
mmetsp:Transcript_72714/g.151903  ORF Transcript_72714/g.151903 Transcript_72714/m.151903 type:complete len:208 (-) Transcript_72714:88-711(-)